MITGARGTKGAPVRTVFMLQALARVASLWQFLLDSSNMTYSKLHLKSDM